jgi:multidrug efflux pump subunit AcrA (membrane-fusion protein)
VEGIVTGGNDIAVNILSGLRVSKINVSRGDSVKEGDVLFTIDMEDLQDIISEKKSELTKIQLQLADINFNNILEGQKKEIAVLWAQEDYESADSETALAVERANENLASAENELAQHLGTTVPYTSDEERQKAWDRYNEWKKRYYEVQDAISEKQTELGRLENSDDDMQEEIDQANEELEKLNKELTNLERNPVSQPDYSLEESEYDAWQSKKALLEEAVETAKQLLEDAQRSRADTLRQKQRDIASTEVYSNANSSDKIYEIEIAEIEKDIAALEAVRNDGGNVCSPNDGYVSEVSVSVGFRTGDEPAVLLNDMSGGCKFNFSITKEEAKYIHLNDTLELTLNGQPAMEINADYVTQNNQGGYDITCKIDNNDVQTGMSGSIKRTVQGEMHTLTLPINAVHEEQNVTYIYTLNEKSGILGSEYYVEKLKVQLVDKNDTYVAIEGGVIGSDAEVIVYSSRELSQGDVVRVN